MIDEGFCLCEALFANRALVQFDPGVTAGVDGEGVAVPERLVAQVAEVGLLTRVNEHVAAEVTVLLKLERILRWGLMSENNLSSANNFINLMVYKKISKNDMSNSTIFNVMLFNEILYLCWTLRTLNASVVND